MTLGEIPDFDPKQQTYTELLKDTLFSAVNIQQFFDPSQFTSWPKTRDQFKKRLNTNAERFKGNYFIILLICIGVFLFRELRALLLVSLWLFYFYVCDNFINSIPEGTDLLQIHTVSFRKEYFLYFCLFVSAMFLILFHGIIFGLVFTMGIFLTLSLTHMTFYRDEECVDEL